MKVDKRSWLNLVIFVVLIQLGFLTYMSQVLVQRAEPPLFELKDGLESLIFQPLDGERIVLQREAEQWWLQEPIHAPVDPLRMQAVLGIAKAQVHSQYDLAELNLAEFGLEPAKALLQLGDVQLAFGDKSPGGKRYVKLGQTLYLLSDVHLPLWAAGGGELVQRRPFDPEEALLSIQTPHIQVEKEAGLWRLSETGEPALAAEQLAESWRFSVAEAVLPFAAELNAAPLLVLTTSGRQWRYRVIDEAPLTLVPEGGNYQLRFSAALSHELLFLPQRAEATPFLDE